MWLKMIARNWQAAVIALLGLGLALSLSHGRYLSANLDAKIAEIDFMKREAESYRAQSEIAAKEINDAFTTLTDQIKGKDLALLNAKKRFGSCNVAGGITAVRVPNLSADAGEARLPESPSGVPEPELIPVDRAFIDGCAGDSAFVRAVQGWRVKNDLPVE